MNEWLRKAAPTILTYVGGVGVVATVISTAKAAPKALKAIEEAKEEKGEELTKFEVVKAAGPAYIPTVIFAAGTIACMFGANVLNKKQQASLVSAYALLENSYKEYKNKVIDIYGEEADEHVRQEVARDRYIDPIEVDDGKELFYDYFSERYFESTMADVLRAENQLNRHIALHTGAYLNEFYEFLDLEPIPGGNELGWSNGILESHYWTNWVDFNHSKVEMDDGLECTIITMMQEPVIDFAYY